MEIKTKNKLAKTSNVENEVKNKLVVQQKNNEIEKAFLTTFRKLSDRHNYYSAWSDFVTLSACSISNAIDKEHFDEREKLYLNIINKYNKEEQVLFPELLAETVGALENNPRQDFLGKMFMLLNIGSKVKGQFFTPYNICDLMAQMIIGVTDIKKAIDEKGYVSLCDPACGAGATLIAGIHKVIDVLKDTKYNVQNHLIVVGQDIDHTVAMMCYIQLSLLGVQGYVKVGDALSEPIIENDTMDNYWFTPMYCLKGIKNRVKERRWIIYGW